MYFERIILGIRNQCCRLGKFNWENFGGDVLLLRERK